MSKPEVKPGSRSYRGPALSHCAFWLSPQRSMNLNLEFRFSSRFQHILISLHNPAFDKSSLTPSSNPTESWLSYIFVIKYERNRVVGLCACMLSPTSLPDCNALTLSDADWVQKREQGPWPLCVCITYSSWCHSKPLVDSNQTGNTGK